MCTDSLKNGAKSHGLRLLAEAVAEDPDVDGLLLLTRLETEQKQCFTGMHTIERVVLVHVPSETWKNAYHVAPIPAVELRKKLLAMTTRAGPMTLRRGASTSSTG